jgi:cytochrome d ubiquinol oxidase subunit I
MFWGMSAETLARFQFAFTMSFHIVFPVFTIGLASYLAVLEGLWLVRRDQVYLKLFDYWKTIFAITFGMGVVSGIVISYQFGTNWAGFADKAGPVVGPLMAYEVLTAFFLEAGFLGVMLFGLKRVGPGLHFAATILVAVGTLISATWIISVNSWMQTPAGFAMNAQGQFIPVDWLKIIFNPSFPYRLVHMVLAAYLTTAFMVGAVGAGHLLANSSSRPARIMLSMAMWMAIIVTPIQMVVGDMHGLNSLEFQPAKVAAIEGHYETTQPAPLVLFGIPDDTAETTRYAIEIPVLGSLILTHTLDGEIKGLKAFPKDMRPPALIPFFSFRIMVGLGVLMLLVGAWALVERLRKRLYADEWLHRVVVTMGPAGFLAVLCGWYTTEVGRQPFTVYGLLRTADSISPVDAPAVGASLIAFIIVYFVVFGAGVFYMFRLMRRSPDAGDDLLDEAPNRAAGITPAQQVEAGGHHDH